MDAFIGQIALFAFGYAPRGWALCEGQLIQIPSNQALYALLGNRFGGDGQRTFALPDLRGKEPLPGIQYFIATSGVYPERG